MQMKWKPWAQELNNFLRFARDLVAQQRIEMDSSNPSLVLQSLNQTFLSLLFLYNLLIIVAKTRRAVVARSQRKAVKTPSV